VSVRSAVACAEKHHRARANPRALPRHHYTHHLGRARVHRTRARARRHPGIQSSSRQEWTGRRTSRPRPGTTVSGAGDPSLYGVYFTAGPKPLFASRSRRGIHGFIGGRLALLTPAAKPHVAGCHAGFARDQFAPDRSRLCVRDLACDRVIART
jgi:hypothetical protein